MVAALSACKPLRPAALEVEIRSECPCWLGYVEVLFPLIFGVDASFLLNPVGLSAEEEIDSWAARLMPYDFYLKHMSRKNAW